MHEYLGYLAEEYRAGRVGRRTFIRWAATLGLGAPTIGAILAACAPAPNAPAPTAVQAAGAAPAATSQPVRGGTMRVTGSPAVEINPHKLTSNGGIITTFPCLNFLARVSADGVPQPELATSWTPSADTKTWTFKLRQGIKFHNGSPFTADDVVATYRRLADKSTGSTAASTLNFLPPDGIEKVDDYTVTFHLSRAQADFPYYTYIYRAGILPGRCTCNTKSPPGLETG